MYRILVLNTANAATLTTKVHQELASAVEEANLCMGNFANMQVKILKEVGTISRPTITIIDEKV